MMSNDLIPTPLEMDAPDVTSGSAPRRRPYQPPALTSSDWPNSTNIAKPTTTIEFTVTFSAYRNS